MNDQVPWRPKHYPAQSFPDQPPPRTLPSEEPPQLPMAIRAVPDSKSPVVGRTLVICLDGTGDKFDSDNSNVVNFVACLKKDDPTQITYYQSGIGTYNGRGGLSKGLSAGIDMAVSVIYPNSEGSPAAGLPTFWRSNSNLRSCRLAVASAFISKMPTNSSCRTTLKETEYVFWDSLAVHTPFAVLQACFTKLGSCLLTIQHKSISPISFTRMIPQMGGK
jgi:hypothetical protein